MSAMGDVAMTVPVINRLLYSYPQLSVTVVSQKMFQPFFEGIERCYFFAAETKQHHKGLSGIWKLFQELKRTQKFDAVADLHGVLRSTVLSKFFRLSGVPIATIDKGRAEKKALTRKTNKILKPLKSTHQRYADVFNALGYAVELVPENSFKPKRPLPQSIESDLLIGKKLIGYAPFAKHAEKQYPLERSRIVVENLANRNDAQILLFGAPGKEAEILESWASDSKHVIAVAGRLSFQQELDLISNLDGMVSMDSGNMHLASMYGVPVKSIWGATHPFAGFNGWNQSADSCIQADLFCRPCSVFGNKPCYRGNVECMHLLKAAEVASAIDF